jgi:ABC-type Fe3+ transport system substrate-binding protein
VKVISRASLVIVLAAFVVGCGGGTTPTTAPATGPAGTGPTGEVDLDSVCAAGAEEGQLVLWHNLLDPPSIIDPWSERYPGMEVEYLDMRPDDAAQRVLTEAAAGQVTPDMLTGEIDHVLPLFERDLTGSPDWTALGIAEDLITETGFVRTDRISGGIAYNTDMAGPEDLPDTWDELIDEQYRGQLVVDPRGVPFNRLAPVWGADRTIEYVTELMEVVQPIVIEGGTAGMNAVVSGEALMSAGGRADSALQMQAEGAPVEMKYMDLIATYDGYNVVLEGARHPNAAMCFIGWIATEGAELYLEAESKFNDTIPPDAPEGAQVVAVETPEDAGLVGDVAGQLGEIITGP